MPVQSTPSRAVRRRSPRFRYAVLTASAVISFGTSAPVAVAEVGAQAPAPDLASTVLAPASKAPTRIAAGGGRVVMMQSTGKNRSGGPSSIYELSKGTEPRLLATVPGGLSWPTVGTDVKGHAVVVVSPCLFAGRTTPLPACNLVAIDLNTGLQKLIPRSKGASIGDLDHGRGVVARRSASVGVRLALLPAQAEGNSTPLPFGAALPEAQSGGYGPQSRYVDSLDLSGGTIVATVLWGMANGGDGGGSALLRHSSGAAAWKQLDDTTYGGASGILRVFRAATVTKTGIRVLFDGGDNEQSFVARWSAAGKVVRDREVDLNILDSAAFDGDRLVTAGAQTVGCGETEAEAAAGCTVVETGPLGLG